MLLRFFLLFSFTLLLPASTAGTEDQMELHLVLAFDVSASVNDAEFDLQRTGTAEALRDSSVVGAIEQAPGGVAIAIVQWSSITQQAVGLDWVHLSDADGVANYADVVHVMPRRLPGGGTMIHAGLDFAASMFETAPGTARRRVIDLAANGQTDDTDKLRESRNRLLRDGVVINGLAIEEDDRGLTSYFYAKIIGGAGAFAVTADDFPVFAQAMKIKLHREIAGSTLSNAPDRTRPAAQASMPPSLSSPASSIRRSKSGTVTWRLPSRCITPSFLSAEI